MKTKLTIKENEKKSVTSYNMKSFNCEICKTPYPLRIRSSNTFYDIIDYTRPVDKNYIILESLNQLKDNNNYKSIQVITLEENEKIVMGRGHETDVRINDISVSRTHAVISLSNNKIFIRDLKSKFGTLVLIQEELEISENPICLQIGRTYSEFQVINQKEYNKIKKEALLKQDDKANQQNKLNMKQLFQVDKPLEKKDSSKLTRPGNLDGMDVDSIYPFHQHNEQNTVNMKERMNQHQESLAGVNYNLLSSYMLSQILDSSNRMLNKIKQPRQDSI